jgi:hypothetical protein
MTVTQIVVLLVSLAPAITAIGCSATRQQPPTAGIHTTNSTQSMQLYDETAHYDAVKNLWIGLDDPTAAQDKHFP